MAEATSHRIDFEKNMTTSEQIKLILKLSLPAIMAQLSSVVMEYIDASMVGHIGSNQAASIGLVASSTWLVGGLYIACSTGFSVQVAHAIGANDYKKARNLVKQGLIVGVAFGVFLALVCALLSPHIPVWLKGTPDIVADASAYFFIYALFLPVMQIRNMCGSMLQSSGNMKLPSILYIVLCILDVFFNYFCIFPSRIVILFEKSLIIPGLGLGVRGAALGTGLSEVAIVVILLYVVLFRSKELSLQKGEKLEFKPKELKKAVSLAWPVALENFLSCGAQIVSTRIVSPLGAMALAANSFAVTAEGLCYMPGFGIAQAAVTVVGQGVGAGEKKTARKLGWISVALGVGLMSASGLLMYMIAPWMIGVMSPDPAIRELGASVLRIEAFAEPMFGASIVIAGVLRGEGDTLSSSIMNFASMWLIRLPLAALFAMRIGLRGVWIAMCIELTIRGLMFIIRLAKKKI